MKESKVKIAEMGEEQLEQLKMLEEELGVCIIALEPRYKLAKLSGKKLKKLQQGEKDLEALLVAYSCE